MSWGRSPISAAGQVGLLAGDYVEGRLQIDGNMRDVMARPRR